MRTGVLVVLAAMMGASMALGGSNERAEFTTNVFDLQFFATPYERSARLGGAYMGDRGSATSVCLNPAALTTLHGPNARGYWAFNRLDGEGGVGGPGVRGPGENETIIARLSDGGLYFASGIASVPGTFGVGGDVFGSDYIAYFVA